MKKKLVVRSKDRISPSSVIASAAKQSHKELLHEIATVPPTAEPRNDRTGKSWLSVIRGLFIFILACCLLPVALQAQPTGAQFLKIPVGARAVGLGSALTTLVDDPTALYWNPAGLSNAKRLDFVATHNIWIAQTDENFVGFSVRVSSSLTAGISYMVFSSNNMERRDDTGVLTGAFGARDQAMSVGGSYRLTRALSLGVTAKTITQSLDAVQAKGMAFDFGFILKPVSKISLGASVSNIGQPMKFINEPYALPRIGRAGLGLAVGPSVNLVASASQNLNDKKSKPDFGFGLEYNLSGMSQSYFWSPVVWRLGYIMPPAPGIGKPAAGIGLKIMGSQIDYAVAPMDDLGFTHRISFRISFGGSTLPNTKTSSPSQFHTSAPADEPVPAIATKDAAPNASNASDWTEQVSSPN